MLFIAFESIFSTTISNSAFCPRYEWQCKRRPSKKRFVCFSSVSVTQHAHLLSPPFVYLDLRLFTPPLASILADSTFSLDARSWNHSRWSTVELSTNKSGDSLLSWNCNGPIYSCFGLFCTGFTSRCHTWGNRCVRRGYQDLVSGIMRGRRRSGGWSFGMHEGTGER